MATNSVSNYTKLLPERLLLSRRDLHWNQIDLAEKSGVSRGHISNIERGHTTNVSVEVIFSLADALGVSSLYLLGLTDDPLFNVSDRERIEEEKERVLKDQEINLQTFRLAQQFIDIFTELTERDQVILLRMAETMRQADTPRIIGEAHDPK